MENMENSNPEKKILIVDDDKFLLDMYSIKFTENGCKVMTALNGDEALRLLAEGEIKPGICLVDVVMPGMDGFELIQKIRENYDHNCSVIVLSNLGQKEDVEKGLKNGADGYIVKASATPSEVVAKVGEIVGANKTSV